MTRAQSGQYQATEESSPGYGGGPGWDVTLLNKGHKIKKCKFARRDEYHFSRSMGVCTTKTLFVVQKSSSKSELFNRFDSKLIKIKKIVTQVSSLNYIKMNIMHAKFYRLQL